MRTNWHKALLVSFVLITSSLAGCLNNDDDDEDMEGKYGTVIVSTYHIEQMVSAIAGDTLNVEMVSKNNIPVHDFEPSLEDIARLGDADLFLYHGLGLEPWVDDTLDSMGDDAPRFGSTHAMPTGEVDLDYESMLITDLCKLLTAGPYDSLYLSLDRDMNEFHAENVAFSLEAAEHDEDEHDEHDEDEHDEHDEDGHDEDEHDGHDGHDEHNHGEAEERIMNPEGCPAESVISIFHLEEGEYIIEFESEHHDEEFNLAVLKMGGGHANHDHGDHDEDEHDEDEHDEDRHDEGEHDEDEHDEDRHDEDEHDEDEHDEHDEDGHDDDESLTSTEMLELADTNNDSSISIDELREFIEMDEHDEICYNTISHIVTNDSEDSCGFYSYYENHSMNGQNFTGCYNTVTHDITGDNETVCGSYMLVENDHDDEEHDDECHIQHTEEEEIAMVTDIFNESDEDGNGLLDLSELENFIRHAHELDDCPEEIDEDLMGYATIHIGAEGEYGFAHSSELMMFILISDEHDSHGHDEHDEDEHDEHDEDGHDEHDEEMVCYNQSTHAVDESYTSEEDCESAGLMWTASNSGPDSHSDEDGHDEEGHDEDEHDEDGHVETLAYDPHSWLDPLAYKVQVGIVLDYLIDTFPDGEDAFIANANEFIEGLEDLDAAFEAALNDGTCTDKTVVANHNAYSYLAYRYDITFVTVHGLDPEGEPSPEDIAKVVEQIEENEITVLFVEEFTDQSSVQSLVEETGVTVEILYTMEMAPSDSDDDYMTMMNKNLESLVSGIGC